MVHMVHGTADVRKGGALGVKACVVSVHIPVADACRLRCGWGAPPAPHQPQMLPLTPPRPSCLCPRAPLLFGESARPSVPQIRTSGAHVSTHFHHPPFRCRCRCKAHCPLDAPPCSAPSPPAPTTSPDSHPPHQHDTHDIPDASHGFSRFTRTHINTTMSTSPPCRAPYLRSVTPCWAPSQPAPTPPCLAKRCSTP